MGSIIKVNEYKDFNNNDIMTSDGAGVITPNATGIKNTPAFSAYYSGGGFTISDATWTTSQITTEFYDTDSAFDTSTYRFTPQTAGKYSFFGNFRGGHSDNNCINNAAIKILKNSSSITYSAFTSDVTSSNPKQYNMSISGSCDLNGSSDYVELQIYLDMVSQTPTIYNSYFGGFKLIGA